MTKKYDFPLAYGGERKDKIEKLLSLHRFNQQTAAAMIDYFVHGASVDMIMLKNGISHQQHISRSVTTMQKTNQTINDLIDIYTTERGIK